MRGLGFLIFILIIQISITFCGDLLSTLFGGNKKSNSETNNNEDNISDDKAKVIHFYFKYFYQNK